MMKNTTIALLITIVFLTAACVQPLKDFKFSVKSGCAAGEENIEIARNISEVIVSGSIITPTPCYDLKVNGQREGNEVTINIEAVSKGGICIQCIGAHDFESSFNLDNGTYTVRILVNENLAKKQEVIIG